MATTITEQIQTKTPPVLPAQSKRMRLDGTDPKFGDWRDDLVRDGL